MTSNLVFYQESFLNFPWFYIYFLLFHNIDFTLQVFELFRISIMTHPLTPYVFPKPVLPFSFLIEFPITLSLLFWNILFCLNLSAPSEYLLTFSAIATVLCFNSSETTSNVFSHNTVFFFFNVCQCHALLTSSSFYDFNWLKSFPSSLILFY